jgi:DNA mismatch repair protein MutS
MANTFPQIKNYRITVSEQDGEIEFLRKIVPGGASKSYGIQVAKMAGIPETVIERSKELMARMQKNSSKNIINKKKTAETTLEIETPQLNLF